MTSDPSVFTILINWNNYTDTKECLDSLCRARYHNSSIVVVDNGSEDGSLERLKREFDDIVFLEMGENLGFTGGNNRGIEYALNHNADYVFLLNNDTIVPHGERELITDLVESMTRQTRTGIVSPLITSYPETDTIWYISGLVDGKRGRLRQEHMGKEITRVDTSSVGCSDFISGCAMFIDTAVFQDVGLLNESYFITLSDVEFSLRVRQSGYELRTVTDSVIHHKESATAGKFGLSYYTARNRWHLLRESTVFDDSAMLWYFWWLIKAVVERSYYDLGYCVDLIRGAIAGLSGEKGKRDDD